MILCGLKMGGYDARFVYIGGQYRFCIVHAQYMVTGPIVLDLALVDQIRETLVNNLRRWHRHLGVTFG